MDEKKKLIVIVGPTAVGKTAMAISIAEHFGTEIISADSRQFYKEMNIGTAKPTHEELGKVKHHFIDSLSIDTDYDVAQFEQEALKMLLEIYKEKETALLVGGSGLFVKAVCEGLDDIPAVDPSWRESLIETYKKSGLEPLQKQLRVLDLTYFEEADINNPRRVIRALEVCLGTGRSFSSFRKKMLKKRDFDVVKIGLEMPREDLYERINKRVDVMMSRGLLEEAKALYGCRKYNALQTVGYQELFDYLSGKYGLEEAIELIKRNTRRYAKRQLTWFKKDPSVVWFDASAVDKVILYLEENGIF